MSMYMPMKRSNTTWLLASDVDSRYADDDVNSPAIAWRIAFFGVQSKTHNSLRQQRKVQMLCEHNLMRSDNLVNNLTDALTIRARTVCQKRGGFRFE